MWEEISEFCCSILPTRNTLGDENEGGMFQLIVNMVYLFVLRGKLPSQFENLVNFRKKAKGIATVDQIHG